MQVEESINNKLCMSLGLSGLPLLRNYFQYVLVLGISNKFYASVLLFGCILLSISDNVFYPRDFVTR